MIFLYRSLTCRCRMSSLSNLCLGDFQLVTSIHAWKMRGRIAEGVVKDFHHELVSSAKQYGAFTPELAASVKRDGVQGRDVSSCQPHLLGWTSPGRRHAIGRLRVNRLLRDVTFQPLHRRSKQRDKTTPNRATSTSRTGGGSFFILLVIGLHEPARLRPDFQWSCWIASRMSINQVAALATPHH